MTSVSSLEALLGNAETSEKRYEWVKAASDYQQAVKKATDSGDLFKAATLQERVGYCLYRGAFQSETRNEFVEGIRSAIEVYEQADRSYARLEEGSPWAYRCSAAASFLRHWLAATASEKGELMKDWFYKQEKALEGFWRRGEKMEYGRTYVRPTQALFEFFFDWVDNEFRKTGLEKGVEWGEKAIAALSELNTKD